MRQRHTKPSFFSEQKTKAAFSVKEVLNIAEDAIDYARDQILKGATQLENNDLPIEYQHYLAYGMDENIGTRGYVKQELMKNGLEQNNLIRYYESYIKVSSKFSLGNCHELSLQALDYIINNNIDIHAEVFEISNGDHVFLVLNRDPHSDSANPMTWGDNAVICDPWANKHYPATKYLSELESYSREDDKNSALAKELVIIPGSYNIRYLKKDRSVDNLKRYFLERCDTIEQLVEYCIKKLENENALLGESDRSKVSAIMDKISKLKVAKTLIASSKESVITDHFDNDYRKANAVLIKNLSNLCQKIADSLKLSPEELSNLNTRLPFQEKKYLYDMQEMLVNLSFLHPTTIAFSKDVGRLKEVFNNCIENIPFSLQAGKERLEQEMQRLVKKFSSQDPAVKIIAKKIKCIQDVQDKIDDCLIFVRESNCNYQETQFLLNNKFMELCADVVASVSFSKKEQEVLYETRGYFGESFNFSSDTKTNLSRLSIICLTVTDCCAAYFSTLSHPPVENISHLSLRP